MIEIRHLKKSFDNLDVFKDVTLTIPPGKTMVIIGKSGCGKTVLLKSIIGLIKPDQGKIIIGGEDITKLNRRHIYRIRKKFGMLFQGAALFDSMNVFDNISLPLREHTVLSDEEIKERVFEKLQMVGLQGVDKKKPSELSGGMKKRVGLARAIIMDPEYILYDEPTTGLDPVHADSINKLVVKTQTKLKITTVIVTHDMSSAIKVADRVAMLHNGRVFFEGASSELTKNDNPILKQFVNGRNDLNHKI
jgi:phospholipid/cholesterol/gamma-HCH transport system ATP-binding protein